MTEVGLIRSNFYSCIYFRKYKEDQLTYMLIYVDDIVVAERNLKEIQKLKLELSKEFDMKDMGNASRILGMDIRRNRLEKKLFLSQKAYLSTYFPGLD